MQTQQGNDATRLGLERYVLELEMYGLTTVPPEATGVSVDTLDCATEVLLKRFTELTGGCPISIEEGPTGELKWDERPQRRDKPDPTQMLIQRLLQLDRCFRDLVVNPVANALIDHMIGPVGGGPHSPERTPPKARRLSSANSFVKWQGEYGLGPYLGLHADQMGVPLPWGRTPLVANSTWCLTDYTKDGGALAYVPGSHKANRYPAGISDLRHAVPAEAPRGSLIVWHGATWHGAYPRLTKGLRLNVTNYFRHEAILPQENLSVTMKDQPWDDCDNPEVMAELLGFNDQFPSLNKPQPAPRFVGSEVA